MKITLIFEGEKTYEKEMESFTINILSFKTLPQL